MIAIGYQDTYDVLPESLVKKASMPRERKSLSEIVFLEELNSSSCYVSYYSNETCRGRSYKWFIVNS
jgi:hypothetical protein